MVKTTALINVFFIIFLFMNFMRISIYFFLIYYDYISIDFSYYSCHINYYKSYTKNEFIFIIPTNLTFIKN